LGYKFVDIAKIYARSGKGGAGCVSFRREANVPRGGPDGGNGGDGGSVILKADFSLSTLLDYRYHPRQMARNGSSGEGRQKSGKNADDKIVKVPVGTVIINTETNENLADLHEDGMCFIVAKGGRGGKGNLHFKSSTHKAPRIAQPGEPGEDLEVRLELKLLADVGLIGFPNVGKSLLISKVSAARPKIADYPFTTLVPNLGVVHFGLHEHFVVADVPGLVVGAHQGTGLGTQFLRHVERVKHIVHLITVEPDLDEREPLPDFEAIEMEIQKHNPKLAQVPRTLVLNRMDLDFVQAYEAEVAAYAKDKNLPFFAISAASGAGIDNLVKHLGHALQQSKEVDAEDEIPAVAPL